MSPRDLIVSSRDLFIKSKGPSAISIELGRLRVHYNEAEGLICKLGSAKGYCAMRAVRSYTARINSNLNLTDTRYNA
jgi:hypothetical protein